MSIYDKYQINVNLIPGLPKIPYENGVGKPEGIVLHATAVFNDTASGERQYETQHYNDAFVNFFCDETQILQCSDTNYISYHACHTSNQKFMSAELCQSYDNEKFAQAYDRWVWLAARMLYDYKLPVVDGQTLLSHAQCTAKWHESTHDDPCGMDGKSGYLASHNKTWANVVADVTNYYNQIKQEKEGYKMTVEDANKLIAILGGLYSAGLAQDEVHRLANELRKASNQPVQN